MVEMRATKERGAARRRLRQRRRPELGIAFFVLALWLAAVPTTAGGQTSGAVYQSTQTAFGPITGGGNCSSALGNETPARALADTLDDDWFTATNKANVDIGLFATADIGPIANDYTLAFPNLALTVDIGKFDISPADAISTAPSSFGTIDTAGGTDPSLLIGGSEQMQDCSPRPLSLVSTAEGGALAQPTPYWNAVGFAADRNTLDSVLFSFSSPVDNFGAWFGDLETRAEDATTGPDDGGELAYVKLYGADGTVLAVEPVLPTNQRPVTNDLAPPGDAAFDDDGFGCGDQTQDEDFSSCGNHGTRFLGFTWPTADVAFMQVIVGDDDHCNEVGLCDGLTEHLSFIGPQVAFDPPELTFTKTVINDHLGALTPADFALTLVEDPASTATTTEHRDGETVELIAGTNYQVTETAVDGYTLVSIECRDETAAILPSVFTPTNDQRITCTIVNDDIAPPTTTTTTTTTSTTTTSVVTSVSTTAVPTTAVSTTAIPTTASPTTADSTTTTEVVTAATASPTTTSATTPTTEPGVATLAVTGSTAAGVIGLGWVLLAAGTGLMALSLRKD